MGDLEEGQLRPGIFQGMVIDAPEIANAYCTARHFRAVYAPASPLISDWDGKSAKERRMLTAAVIKEVFDDTYRDLADRLASDRTIAKAAGFDSTDAVPSYTTLSKSIRQFDRDLIEEAATQAQNATLHAAMNAAIPEKLPAEPGKPNQYYDHVKLDSADEMERKMSLATDRIEEYLQLVADHIGFDRDHSAPRFTYETGEFYQLLAHLALENSFAHNGAEILQWLKDDIQVPPPSTLRDYVSQYSVHELEEKFMRAACELLTQPGLKPAEPLTLAFDITKVKWYGDENNRWTTGNVQKDNTSEFWHIGVLCVCSSEYNYILGATPVQKKSNKSATLRRMLKWFRQLTDYDVDRCYLDSEFFERAAFEACRDFNVDAMIQAKPVGDVGELLDDVDQGGYDSASNVDFSSLTPRPDAFVAPVNPEETGAENQDSHTAWITDLDVTARDLRGLAYQYRYRWRIETAINQLKNTFLGRCKSSQRQIRTLYFGAAQMFFNFWVALRSDLPSQMGDMADIRVTGQELLHAIREADC